MLITLGACPIDGVESDTDSSSTDASEDASGEPATAPTGSPTTVTPDMSDTSVDETGIGPTEASTNHEASTQNTSEDAEPTESTTLEPPDGASETTLSEGEAETSVDSDSGGYLGPSAGCGGTATPSFSGQIEVLGQSRTYLVDVPDDYDPSVPYPLLFGFHGSYDSAEGARFGYQLRERWQGQAFAVYPDGLVDPSIDARTWISRDLDGPDVTLVEALLDELEEAACIDRNRVFAFGYSAGGYMAGTAACILGGRFRGLGTVSGGLSPTDCGAQAAYLMHGLEDEVVPTSQGLSARDAWLMFNGCDPERSEIWGGDTRCETFLGCETDAPLVWCTHPGGHMFDGAYAAAAIALFQSLE